MCFTVTNEIECTIAWHVAMSMIQCAMCLLSLDSVAKLDNGITYSPIYQQSHAVHCKSIDRRVSNR